MMVTITASTMVTCSGVGFSPSAWSSSNSVKLTRPMRSVTRLLPRTRMSSAS
jgi:hypothetical protein